MIDTADRINVPIHDRARVEALTLRDYLEDCRKAQADPERGLTDMGEKVIGRLELIEDLVPGWLTFDFFHPLREAVEGWDSLYFGILIGRAIVLPREMGEDLTDPARLWFFASIGVGPSNKLGRREVLGTSDQTKIYYMWTKGVPQQELAEIFGISVRSVGRIIRRWKPER